jgi:hypothetical protein
MAIIELGADRLDPGLEADVESASPDRVVDDAVSGSVTPVEEHQPDVVTPQPIAGLTERLSPWWAAGLVVAWVGIFSTGVALEPAPADPDAALPFIEGLLVLGLMVSWVVAAVGLAGRRRYGAFGSLVAGVFLVGMTIACPVSGHHVGIGAWWWFEAVGSTALVALSGRALRSA